MFSDFKLSKIKVPRSFRKGDPPKYELIISNYDLKNLNQDEDDVIVMTEGVTSSSVSSGSSFSSGSLLPTSNKKFKKITRKMDSIEEEEEKFGYEPPESGDAPQEVKDILAKVYAATRKSNPDYDEERCSKIAWGAVHNAGWMKDTNDVWHKNELIEQSQDIEIDTIKELFVVNRNGKWCVIHGHPQKPGSKTDKPEGSIIKCFPGTPEGKSQAEAMHKAIIISKIKRGEMGQEISELNDVKDLINKLNDMDIDSNYSIHMNNIGNHHIILFDKINE
jgi:cation transport regulator ChaB